MNTGDVSVVSCMWRHITAGTVCSHVPQNTAVSKLDCQHLLSADSL